MLHDFAQAIATFVRDHENWALAVIFLIAFGESFCFFSLFWPGTTILAAVMLVMAASSVEMSILVPAIVAAGAGGSLGYAISYWLGYYFKDRIGEIWPFRDRPHLVPKGQKFFDTYGTFAVFLGHFVGPVRAVIPVVAGIFAMPQVPFQIANVTSAFLWAAGVIAPSFFVVTFWQPISAFLHDYQALTAAILFLLAFVLSIPNAFAFVPASVLFVVLGGLHVLAGGNFWLILFAGAAGSITGDALGYRAGRNGTGPAWLVPDAERLAQARAFVERNGSEGVITSKFLGLLRTEVPHVAGLAAMPYAQFTLASVLAALLWSLLFLFPGLILRPILGL